LAVDRLDQVLPLKAAIDARRDAAPPGKKPFERVITIFDLVPSDQAAKLELVAKMRALIVRVRELRAISDDDWGRLEPDLPPSDLVAFGVADLPLPVARAFTEKDGTRGRVVYIVPTDGESMHDLRYLIRWADAFRETKLPSGERVLGSGRAVIFADMIDAVVAEAPRSTALSFVMTTLVVALAFLRGPRGKRAVALVLATLAIGLSIMGAVLAAMHVKINFLNFIALPITVGICVDYAVNIVHRWRVEEPGSVGRIVRETGGAVILCSLTTTLGYFALLTSINKAVRSFGLVAVIGEVTCVLTAVLVLPAMLATLDRFARGAFASSPRPIE